MMRYKIRLYCKKDFWGAALVMILSAATLGLGGCSLSGPPATEYVLGTIPAAKAAFVSQTGRPVVDVERVQIPDYLDTTDLLERRGNQLVPSSIGRWGERLSLGITRALTDSLAARLPQMVVTATMRGEHPARRIIVDVTTFDNAGQDIVLSADWRILGGTTGRTILAAEQAYLVVPITGSGDSGVVAAMSHAIEQLADELAVEIEGDLRSGVSVAR